MRQILLVCSAGMSTSLLVTKMEGAAKEAGYDAKIFALPFSDAPRVLEDVDVILLGPQVRFQKGAIEKLAAGRKKGPIPVEVIDMRDYGTMNGKAVFEMAKKINRRLIKKYVKKDYFNNLFYKLVKEGIKYYEKNYVSMCCRYVY